MGLKLNKKDKSSKDLLSKDKTSLTSKTNQSVRLSFKTLTKAEVEAERPLSAYSYLV